MISMVYVLLTNILEQSSQLLYYGNNASIILSAAFGEEVIQNKECNLQGVVSRKKQFIPAIMEALQNF